MFLLPAPAAANPYALADVMGFAQPAQPQPGQSTGGGAAQPGGAQPGQTTAGGGVAEPPQPDADPDLTPTSSKDPDSQEQEWPEEAPPPDDA